MLGYNCNSSLFETTRFIFRLVIVIVPEIAEIDTHSLALYWDIYWNCSFFVAGVIFNLAQVFITLISIFFDGNGVTLNSWAIGKLALLAFTVCTRIFLGLTQSLD